MTMRRRSVNPQRAIEAAGVEFIDENGGGPGCPVTEATTEKRLGSQTPTWERFLTRAASFYGRKCKTKPNSKIVSIGTTASSSSRRTAADQVSGYGSDNRKDVRGKLNGVITGEGDALFARLRSSRRPGISPQRPLLRKRFWQN